MGIAEMTLTPEKLDELERLAELATPGPWYYAGCNTVHDANHDEVAHPCDIGNDCATARFIAALDPATVRELVRAARIGHCFVNEKASPLKMRRLHELAQACKEVPHD